MINTITLEGNLTRDPELRFTQGGKAVCGIRIAHTPRRNVGGQWQDGTTTFIDVQAWGSLAENITETLAKGDKIVVTGRVDTEEYTTKAGVPGSKLLIKADDVAVSLNRVSAAINRTPRGDVTTSDTTAPW